MSRKLNPKEFIQKVLIDEIGQIKDKHPYLAFILIGTGIEFLGKCINAHRTDWFQRRKSRYDFELAINELDALTKYREYIGYENEYDLYGNYRCGLAHASVPKQKITLSSKDEADHLLKHGVRLNLKVEDFYEDFKKACIEVIDRDFNDNDKMKRSFIELPGDDTSEDGHISFSGSTAI